MFHMRDIQSSPSNLQTKLDYTTLRDSKCQRNLISTHRSGHEHGRASGTEAAQGVLTLALRAVAVDRGHGVPFFVQVVFQSIGALLRLDEHESQRLLSCEQQLTVA